MNECLRILHGYDVFAELKMPRKLSVRNAPLAAFSGETKSLSTRQCINGNLRGVRTDEQRAVPTRQTVCSVLAGNLCEGIREGEGGISNESSIISFVSTHLGVIFAVLGHAKRQAKSEKRKMQKITFTDSLFSFYLMQRSAHNLRRVYRAIDLFN